MSALQIQNLSKKFKKNSFYSLEQVNLEINDGDIVGLVGRNGAGKSTLLKSIAKFYTPTCGTITYHGQDIFQSSNMLRDVGILIEPVFYPYMTVQENLEFYLEIHGKKEFQKNILPILELVDLSKWMHKKPESFSFGMKQRLSLAMVLVDEPDFLILDEPFVGLDPYGVRELLGILKKWVRARQISMMISSHQLNELESICSRFVRMENGRLTEMRVKDGETLENYFVKGENHADSNFSNRL